MKKELVILAALIAAFLFLYINPWVDTETLDQRDASITGRMEKRDSAGAVVTVFSILKEYAQNHIITCLVPAFFIAGAIAVFAKKETVLKLLGHATKKYIAYPIASISGAVLAV